MKLYTVETTLTFGKYNGKSIRDILVIQPSYLDWCIINLEHFYLDDDVIESMEATNKFKISSQAQGILSKKKQNWLTQNNDSDYNYNRDADYYKSNSDRDNFYALTDGQYGNYEDWGGNWDNLRDSMGY